MRRIIFSLMLALTVTTWAADQNLVPLECSLKKIHRAKVHPTNPAPSNSATTTTSSTNWSGYVSGSTLRGGGSSNGTVNDVAGSWTVPMLAPETGHNYSAIWVGIDGFTSASVEQIGTSHDWVNGNQVNYAWFEMYPSGSYEITGFPVEANDVISADVTYVGNNTFQFTISNQTKGVSTTIPTSYTVSTSAARSCAEWVVEAPFSGEILPLSDFQIVNFNNCSTTINGIKAPINHWTNEEIMMIGNTGALEAIPSPLSNNGTAFNVTWKAKN